MTSFYEIIGGVVFKENGLTIPSPKELPIELLKASRLGLTPDPGPKDG